MMPSTGGDFDYLKRAYGDYAAFSFTWFFFWISKSGSQAIVATVFGNYLVQIFTGLGDSDGTTTIAKILSVSLLVSLTFLNCLGLQSSKSIANILTALKIGLILIVCVSGIVYVSRKQQNLMYGPRLPPPFPSDSS
jgi:basic amino acid/polyamine antiporter, APA family